MVNLCYDEMISPVGPLTLLSNGKKLIRIDYGLMEDKKEELYRWVCRYFTEPVFIREPKIVADAQSQLMNYFTSKQESFSLNLEFYGTDFQKKVWKTLYDIIPFGETKTYKDIAVSIGNPKAVRAVGGAVNKNPFSIVVPCHRVVGTNGKLVGYNGGLDKKEYLLNHELVYAIF